LIPLLWDFWYYTIPYSRRTPVLNSSHHYILKTGCLQKAFVSFLFVTSHFLDHTQPPPIENYSITETETSLHYIPALLQKEKSKKKEQAIQQHIINFT